MLTVVKVMFGFCAFFLTFEETASWTIDLPQVRKYFFEKNMLERERQDRWNMQQQPEIPQQVVYDNIHTKSLHFDYEKYKKHYADDYKYNGYMENKVHEAVQNGSAYLDGLRRSIESYLQRLESCRQQNLTVNMVQLRRYSGRNASKAALYYFLTNPANPITNPTKPSFMQAGILTLLLPFSTYGLPIPTNFTTVTPMSMNFTEFLAMAPNYTIFNMSEEFRNCVRADLASEHVRRLAELAVWAASELQDKLYADKYSEHHHVHGTHESDQGHENAIFGSYGHGHEKSQGHGQGHRDHEHDDDTLVLRLAWFLDRLAHLTGYDPTAQDFGPVTAPPPTSQPMIPTLISNADLQFLTNCIQGTNGTAIERCSLPEGYTPPNLETMRAMGMFQARQPQDLRPSASEAEEYTYSEQVFTDDDMPLSLPVKAKHKRSVQRDPLDNFVQLFAKYKAWSGSNLERTSEMSAEKHDSETSVEKYDSDMSHVNTNKENVSRKKRFVVKNKEKHLKPEPFPIASYVKHKIEGHIKKDEKEAKAWKKFLEKLHKPKAEVKLLKFKKSKRSIKYSKKQQPRVPNDPQMDISYFVKNKEGAEYDYNPVQAALVRAGLEQVFQTGNIEVVHRYGSNYNPALRETIANGFMLGYNDN